VAVVVNIIIPAVPLVQAVQADQVEAVAVAPQVVLQELETQQFKVLLVVLDRLIAAVGHLVVVVAVQVPQELQEALAELLVMVVMDYRQL
tara:strand:- start:462 stop:731 length:270 start_codon:yes stop_codon:yes gene_type:complete